MNCSSERPLKPVHTDLRLYIGATDFTVERPWPSILFIYDLDSLTALDSLKLPAPSSEGVASKDRRSLYVSTLDAENHRAVWSIDLHSGDTNWSHRLGIWDGTFEGRVGLRAYSNEQVLIWMRHVIRSSDGSLVRIFPDTLFPYGGPTAGNRIALSVTLGDDYYPTRLVGYDLNTDTVWGSYVPHLQSQPPFRAIFNAELHQDHNRVLVIGYPAFGSRAWFVIGDLATGETLIQQQLGYPFGKIAITPEGSLAVVSDPSDPLHNDTYTTLDFFSLDTLRHIKRLSESVGDYDSRIRPGALALVPDRDLLVVTPPGDFLSYGQFAIVDLRSMEVVDQFWFPGQADAPLYALGCLAIGEMLRSK